MSETKTKQECKTCNTVKSMDAFERVSGTGYYRRSCRDCRNEYRRTHGYRYDPEYHREYHRKRKYGISSEQVEEMRKRQGGVCPGCGVELRASSGYRSGAGNECVDHCHETGRVRGLLCGRCNSAAGYAKDDPARLRALADYLENA